MNAKPSKKAFRLSLRLSHLILIVTACAAWIAFYTACLKRQQVIEDLKQISFAAELAPLDDPTLHQLIRTRSLRRYASCRWVAWVPYHKSSCLRWATDGLSSDEFPVNSTQLELKPGRHTIELLPAEDDKTVQLKVDGRIVFDRKMQRDWNIAAPWASAQTISPARTLSQPIEIFKAFGTARLAADEEFDPNLHRFGLQIWLGE